MSSSKRPSRVLLVIAGILTQLGCAGCLVAALASIPVVHDVHGSGTTVVVTALCAFVGIVCAVFVYSARLVPLALAMGIDVGFGIVLPRANSPLGALGQILPKSDAGTLDTLVTIGSIMMFAAGILCAVALPTALAMRRWREEPEPVAAGGAEPGPGETLKGFEPARAVPTMMVRVPQPAAKKSALIIAISAVVLVGVGIALIAATDDGNGAGSGSAGSAAVAGGSDGSGAMLAGSAGTDSPDPGSAAATDTLDAGVGSADLVDAAAPAPDPQTLVDAFHKALGTADKAALAELLDPQAFAVGIEAHELAEGRDATIALLQNDVGGKRQDVDAARSYLAHEGDVAWVAEEMRAGGKRLLVTFAAGLRDGKWTIAALHVAQAMANDAAHQHARDGSLAIPDAIPSAKDESALAQAMRVAFASMPSFVDARSTRSDAFNFGSAPGERMVGGAAIKKTFGRLRATIHLHDAVKVGMLGENGGWGVANVDFTDSDADGEVTQTFRVLAIWLREPATADGKWRIVQTQWSNAQ